MYQALYRKYRPQTFDDVVGQDAVTQTLRTQLKTGRISHAYLFTGTRGTGKTSCAKILAKALNCTELQDGSPCGRCAACRAIDSGSCMDVLEIDAASNNGVDQVRALRDDAVYTPSEVSRRVYIIDEVHMLSMAAFNALLKIIEEPPEHLVFILATTELQKVPATILSRCQRYAFRRLLPEDISKRLNYIAYQEGIDLEPDACRLLSRLADGALRDGVSLLDQCASAAEGAVTADLVCNALGLAGERRTVELMTAVANGDAKGALELFSGLYAAGKDLAAMLDELLSLSRDLLILQAAPKTGLPLLSGIATDAEAQALLPRFTAAELLRITTVLQETAAGFSKSANRRIDAELCLLRLCQPALDENLTTLTARVARMESQLQSGQFVAAAAAPPPPASEDEELPPPPDDADAPPPAEGEAPPMAPARDGFGADFLQQLRREVSNQYKGFLGADGPTRLRVEDQLLTLEAESNYVKCVLDRPEVLEPAARIATALLGRPIRVRCVQRQKRGAAGADDPLRSLVDFGRSHPDLINIKK